MSEWCLSLAAVRKNMGKIAAGSDTRSVVLVGQGLCQRDRTFEKKAGSDCSRVETDEEYIYSRYDQVVHLETAANGAMSHYHSKRESPEEALMIDRAVRRAWTGHKNFSL